MEIIAATPIAILQHSLQEGPEALQAQVETLASTVWHGGQQRCYG